MIVEEPMGLRVRILAHKVELGSEFYKTCVNEFGLHKKYDFSYFQQNKCGPNFWKLMANWLVNMRSAQLQWN